MNKATEAAERVTDAAEKVTAAARDKMDDLHGQIRELRAKLDTIIESLAHAGEEKTATMRARASARVDELRASGAEHLHHAQEVAADTLGDVETYARRHPGRALAVAAGLGLFAGLILNRR